MADKSYNNIKSFFNKLMNANNPIRIDNVIIVNESSSIKALGAKKVSTEKVQDDKKEKTSNLKKEKALKKIAKKKEKDDNKKQQSNVSKEKALKKIESQKKKIEAGSIFEQFGSLIGKKFDDFKQTKIGGAITSGIGNVGTTTKKGVGGALKETTLIGQTVGLLGKTMKSFGLDTLFGGGNKKEKDDKKQKKIDEFIRKQEVRLYKSKVQEKGLDSLKQVVIIGRESKLQDKLVNKKLEKAQKKDLKRIKKEKKKQAKIEEKRHKEITDELEGIVEENSKSKFIQELLLKGAGIALAMGTIKLLALTIFQSAILPAAKFIVKTFLGIKSWVGDLLKRIINGFVVLGANIQIMGATIQLGLANLKDVFGDASKEKNAAYASLIKANKRKSNVRMSNFGVDTRSVDQKSANFKQERKDLEVKNAELKAKQAKETNQKKKDKLQKSINKNNEKQEKLKISQEKKLQKEKEFIAKNLQLTDITKQKEMVTGDKFGKDMKKKFKTKETGDEKLLINEQQNKINEMTNRLKQVQKLGAATSDSDTKALIETYKKQLKDLQKTFTDTVNKIAKEDKNVKKTDEYNVDNRPDNLWNYITTNNPGE